MGRLPESVTKSNFTLETEVKGKATGDQVEVEMRVRVDHLSGAFERFVAPVTNALPVGQSATGGRPGRKKTHPRYALLQ